MYNVQIVTAIKRAQAERNGMLLIESTNVQYVNRLRSRLLQLI